jgi:exopolysaccharide transport family protein
MSDLAGLSQNRGTVGGGLHGRAFDFGEFVRLLLRRKKFIIGFVLASALVALPVIKSLTPIYTAATDILIDTVEPNITEIKAVITDQTTDKAALLSEIEVIRSRGLAEKVVDQLQLDQDPEFNPALQVPSPLDQLRASIGAVLTNHLPDSVLSALGYDPQAENQGPEQSLARQRDATVDNFLENLIVLVKGESRAITIAFDSDSAQKSALVANTIADAYILDKLDVKYEATRRANQWLASKLEDMRKKVAQSEGAVEAYRRDAGLLQGQEGSLLVSQQVSDLNAQLIIARTERAAAEARLTQVRRMLQSSGGVDAAADVLQSPIIQTLTAQETEAKRKVIEMSNSYGERHPRLITARAELKDLQSKIAAEVNKIVQSLQSDAAVARAREGTLAGGLRQVESRVAQANSSSVQLRALEREAQADKSLLELFLSRFSQINAQTDFAVHQPNARIISKASVPRWPTAPRTMLLLAMTLVASSIFAVLFVLAFEYLNRGFRSGEQIEELTGVRTLGLIPQIKVGGKKARSPETVLVKQPQSLFGESIRSLFTSILISQNQAPPKTLIITSCHPKEGKTTVAVCLTRIAAMSGRKAVIVETDLRKPQVHARLGLPQAPGLVEYFLGENDLSEVLHKDEATGAFAIPAGKASVDPTKLLDSPEMTRLIAGLSSQFDLVILDTPPIMAVADARLIAPQVDGTIFVARWGKTERDVVKLGLKTLIDAGSRVFGAVLTMVDVEQHAAYGFGDSGYYHKGIKRYYTH